MPSPRRAGARALVTILLSGWVLGLLPPARGGEVAQPRVRVVALDEDRLLPRSARSLARGAEAVKLDEAAWSRPARVCDPQGFTMAGLAWEGSGEVPVRARIAWWGGDRGRARLEADPDEGPDPGSPDEAGLEGTPPLWTGEARCIEVRVRLPRLEPLASMRAVLVDTSAPEPSFLDRAGHLLAQAWGLVAAPFDAPAAEATAAQPPIITRAGWGANEKLRRCGPDYAPALKMAHVHHTVNSNSYSARQAPELIRGIYSYHVKGRRFCDIAYNFLIDRFGRIYEGRYGGIDQPVVGAHAMGFNTGSTGVAALGTFTSKSPPARVISAYKRLLAWRLDVAHLRPTGWTTMTSGGGTSSRFDKGQQVSLPVISGHRDTGLTSCPGARLYAKLKRIRRGAEARGAPKIWDPLVSPNPAPAGTTQVQLSAAFSQEMDWTVEIYNTTAPTVPFKRFAGRGSSLLLTWDRSGDDPLASPAPAGSYQVYFRATSGVLTAREAVLTLTLY